MNAPSARLISPSQQGIIHIMDRRGNYEFAKKLAAFFHVPVELFIQEDAYPHQPELVAENPRPH
jgi:hypothetical protein